MSYIFSHPDVKKIPPENAYNFRLWRKTQTMDFLANPSEAWDPKVLPY